MAHYHWLLENTRETKPLVAKKKNTIRKHKKTEQRGHMIKCLLTEFGRTGRVNIWLSVRTSWPRAKYFPVRPSHSVNKYIIFTRAKITVATGYIINRAFPREKWNSLVFHWCLYLNRTLHGRLEIRNFSFCVEKYFTRSLFNTRGEISLVRFSTLEEKFRISARPCNILFFCLIIFRIVGRLFTAVSNGVRPTNSWTCERSVQFQK